jgi:hypothetical protein
MSDKYFDLFPELPSNSDIKNICTGWIAILHKEKWFVDLNNMRLHSQELGVAVLVYYWTENALFNIHAT